jgi:uncharacterized protein (DUF433 family)
METTDYTLTVPLRRDDDGAVRIADTRILLEMVIHAFQEGATPEAIALSFDSLQLADVYAVLGYYLANPEDVHHYLQARDVEADRTRQQVECRQGPTSDLRDRLLARSARQEPARAPSGQ